jgi:hypothetical protein
LSKAGTIKWLCKALVAGVAALLVLNLFCALYYNVPFRIPAPDGITDYAWSQGAFSSRLTEGFGYGFIDKNGYNNAEVLAEVDDPDVLVMGSSHMEAFNVPQDKSTAYVLDGLLREYGLNAYSIGISGHDFFAASKNLPAALRAKKPRYVVIETGSVDFPAQAFEDYINGDREPVRENRGALEQLTRVPYFRLLYTQWQNLHENNNNEQAGGAGGILPSAELLQKYMDSVSNAAAGSGAKIIIFYHPQLLIDGGGGVAVAGDVKAVSDFSAACANAGIAFVDLTETFVEAYRRNHVLPHGFFNTEIGTGHLNEYGHRMAAEELAETIIAIEGGAQ